jgi:hypothetical protein
MRAPGLNELSRPGAAAGVLPIITFGSAVAMKSGGS